MITRALLRLFPFLCLLVLAASNTDKHKDNTSRLRRLKGMHGNNNNMVESSASPPMENDWSPLEEANPGINRSNRHELRFLEKKKSKAKDSKRKRKQKKRRKKKKSKKTSPTPRPTIAVTPRPTTAVTPPPTPRPTTAVTSPPTTAVTPPPTLRPTTAVTSPPTEAVTRAPVLDERTSDRERLIVTRAEADDDGLNS